MIWRPYFLGPDGKPNERAARIALREMGEEPEDKSQFEFLKSLDPYKLERKARGIVMRRYPDEALWDEDVSLLGVAGGKFRR